MAYYEGVEYPASSPHVISVGATKLLLSGGARQSETIWNEGPSVAGKNEGADGGGCSVNFQAAVWQREVPDWAAVGCGSKRAVADVAADGDPYTGIAVYYAAPRGTGSWRTFGGTSVSSPIIAAMYALAGGSHGVAYPAQTLYEHLGTPWLYDIDQGGDGKCDGDYTSGCGGSMTPLSPFDCGEGVLVCNAGPGYDGPSGVGAPNALSAFIPGAEPPSQLQTTTPSTDQESPGGTTSPTGQVPKTDSSSTPKGPAPIGISHILLTPTANEAISHGWPQVASIAFAFTLSDPATLEATLSKFVHRHRHSRWQILRDSVAITGRRGANHARLQAPGRLAPGLYRLRLRPVRGDAGSLLIRVPAGGVL
jgi:hypothetical protein